MKQQRHPKSTSESGEILTMHTWCTTSHSCWGLKRRSLRCRHGRQRRSPGWRTSRLYTRGQSLGWQSRAKRGAAAELTATFPGDEASRTRGERQRERYSNGGSGEGMKDMVWGGELKAKSRLTTPTWSELEVRVPIQEYTRVHTPQAPRTKTRPEKQHAGLCTGFRYNWSSSPILECDLHRQIQPTDASFNRKEIPNPF